MKALNAAGRPLRSKENRIFLTADQLEERATARIKDAERLPPGEARQHALKNAAQLRSYAAMKRLLSAAQPAKIAPEADGASDVGR